MSNQTAVNPHRPPYEYRPLFFKKSDPKDRAYIETLRRNGDILFECDEIERQLRELMRCRYLNEPESGYQARITALLMGCDLEEYGVWVYYPWRKTLVHLLDEEAFIEVRTNRNQYKITQTERHLLRTKKLGIIGLSVGQSIALTIAMERICGELRLADFDTLDLSNLNRIRAGVFSLSIPKVIIAAREIAEIDPYLKVSIFPEGLNSENYGAFFSNGGPLDLLVEVCDSFEIKVESRFFARELGIPVVMETNDRGMVDVERFDKEPSRPIFHGLAGQLTPDTLGEIGEAERLSYLMKIVEADKLSVRMKQSIPEIGQSISSWPQLASAVTLGGAVTTDVCRRILLGTFESSGRYYVDMEELIS